MQRRGQSYTPLPDLLRAHQPEGWVRGQPGRIVQILVARQPAVDRLPQQVGLGLGGERAFQRDESPSVLLFVWGTHILPVFLTSVRVDEKAHLPSLVPYRANATLTMQVIEGNNPFYQVEKVRQVISAGLNTAQTVSGALGGLF